LRVNDFAAQNATQNSDGSLSKDHAQDAAESYRLPFTKVALKNTFKLHKT
jgi:hypothetical protein